MRVGFFSPLPPARTGIADYSAALLPWLRRQALEQNGSVVVNADDADVYLYHLGNNQLHREIYQRALGRPGVAVLHDAVLHHFFLGSLGEAEYIREFTYNYGGWSEDQARELWRERARSATDPRYFRYPLLKRIAETSRAVVVHNPGAAEMVRRHAPSAKIHEIPHLFEPPGLPQPVDIERARGALGIAHSTLLCGVFGHLRESKRLLPVVRAFREARRKADIALLVAGEWSSSDLARAAAPLLHAPGIFRYGYTPPEQFRKLASMVDVCINLRYPAAGETSGIGIALMGLGKPVIFSAGPETTRLPEATCLLVDAGEAEEAMLMDYLIWLAQHRSDARAIGSRAATYIREKHRPDRVAELYWQACEAARLAELLRLNTIRPKLKP